MKKLNLNEFPRIDKKDWTKLAEAQLKGSDPFTSLRWNSDGFIPMDPYLDQSDLEGLTYLNDFFKTLNPFQWKLYEEVFVKNEEDANLEALKALEGGCDGIIFFVNDQIKIKTLLENIHPEICDLSLIVADDKTEIEFDSKKFSGFMITPQETNAYRKSPSSKSQVDKIVDIITNMTNGQQLCREASEDFFLEIASIRALRYLINQKFEIPPDQIKIHTSVPLNSDPDQQWFNNSTAGLASILGGTNSISFSTAQGPTRISRNVGNIIRDECGITTYNDQCGGSYYVEALTDKIISTCQERLV